MNIAIKRVYEPPHRNDGLRVLVDRLWPRGLSKDAAQIDIWAKELAPSHELRRWFHSDEGNWPGFKTRYRIETLAQVVKLSNHIGRANLGTFNMAKITAGLDGSIATYWHS